MRVSKWRWCFGGKGRCWGWRGMPLIQVILLDCSCSLRSECQLVLLMAFPMSALSYYLMPSGSWIKFKPSEVSITHISTFMSLVDQSSQIRYYHVQWYWTFFALWFTYWENKLRKCCWSRICCLIVFMPIVCSWILLLYEKKWSEWVRMENDRFIGYWIQAQLNLGLVGW